MRKLLVLSLLILLFQPVWAQVDEDDVFDEAGMVEKIKTQAEKDGYKIFREPTDTSRSFTAEAGRSYRLVLIFREHIEAPGRRLVVYQRDKDKKLKTLYMARKDQHINSLNGHMLVTDVPAVQAGNAFIFMTIDALPKEGKLFIFRK
jgi:hypothetical protein